MQYKNAKKFSWGLYLLAIVLLLARSSTTNGTALYTGLTVGSVVLVVLGVIVTFKYYRCPHCGQLLSRGGVPTVCPSCGKKLDDPVEK